LALKVDWTIRGELSWSKAAAPPTPSAVLPLKMQLMSRGAAS
jgi:hypothetical protein